MEESPEVGGGGGETEVDDETGGGDAADGDLAAAELGDEGGKEHGHRPLQVLRAEERHGVCEEADALMLNLPVLVAQNFAQGADQVHLESIDLLTSQERMGFIQGRADKLTLGLGVWNTLTSVVEYQ